MDSSQILMQANVVLEAAYAENWELVNELVPRWHSALLLFFNCLNPELKQTIDQTTVHELIDLNQRLIELVKKGRDSTANQIKQFTLSRRAIATYHEGNR